MKKAYMEGEKECAELSLHYGASIYPKSLVSFDPKHFLRKIKDSHHICL